MPLTGIILGPLTPIVLREMKLGRVFPGFWQFLFLVSCKCLSSDWLLLTSRCTHVNKEMQCVINSFRFCANYISTKHIFKSMIQHAPATARLCARRTFAQNWELPFTTRPVLTARRHGQHSPIPKEANTFCSHQRLFSTIIGRHNIREKSTITTPCQKSSVKLGDEEGVNTNDVELSPLTKGKLQAQYEPASDSQTIYALSTAAGRGAIAIIRISGPACMLVRPSLASHLLQLTSHLDLPCLVPKEETPTGAICHCASPAPSERYEQHTRFGRDSALFRCTAHGYRRRYARTARTWWTCDCQSRHVCYLRGEFSGHSCRSSW